ncbi:hypothetical protein A9Z42_0006700 [Trichoderma parareesei]|uniref:Protein kinase domain-containing protein n=1 Tax=Trichoderma parareesei TaxID=858221 RepID=A0A2H2ZKF0_TRIPA|nr:hypothetical protein A9Z42_0006700 [Trichoderma parareesei]
MSMPAILIDLIWGNDDETQVFAHAHDTANNSPLLTFRLTQDTTQQPQSFANRIASRFHELPVSSSSATFPDRASMRKALGAAIQRAWPSCAHAAAAPDAVVDLFDDDDDKHDEQGGAEGEGEGVNVQWRVRYESTLYQEFLDALLPVDVFFFPDNMHSSSREAIKLIDIKDIVLIHPLPGRGTSALVHILSDPNALYAMKSIAFTDLLNSREELTYNRNSLYHSIKLTSSTIPPHPNIQPPPRTLLTTTHHNKVLLLRGTLYPYMNQGTLDTQITTAQEAHNQPRISLQSKARWCLQMCQALLHTHRTAKTFHMDIKPANFLVNDHGNLVLIDWEQSGAPWYTLAPEANGEWDVARVSDDDDDDGNDDDASQLVYSRYQGPERVNLPRGRPAWNVFPEWSEKWPMAAEAAEVFSLGRTMWMLLQQVPQEDIELLSPDELHVCWSEVAADIPDAWKEVVMQCMEKDPLARIKLTNLVNFWEQQQQIL